VTPPSSPTASAATTASTPPAPPSLSVCPACGEDLVDGARFCEACGAPADGAATSAGTGGTATEASGAADTTEASTASTASTESSPTATAARCERCGGDVDADRYCTSCGHRALEPVEVDDRSSLAFATHRGRRHARNEDAGALAATGEGWPVLVVADGVSSSPNPDRAASAAVAGAAQHLADRPFTGEGDLLGAVVVGNEAASAVPEAGDPHWAEDGSHPACTVVVAVVTDAAVHMANVGDARGYVVRPDGSGAWACTQLTADDSVAALAVADGVDPEVALASPGGHAITAWLGADARRLDPNRAHHPVAPDDLVLVCSDGLWNYAATDAAMGELLTAVLPPAERLSASLAGVCEQLVSWANEQGGVDNITVALAAVPRGGGDTEPGGPDTDPGDPDGARGEPDTSTWEDNT
jgi:serine/threonine protein phosphatase PrpC